MENWIKTFSDECYKSNTYEFHPYGQLVVRSSGKSVVCFYPLFDKNGRLYSFVVNWFRVKYLDESTWYRECSNRNTAENCTKHRQYRPDEAFKIYQKILKEHKK